MSLQLLKAPQGHYTLFDTRTNRIVRTFDTPAGYATYMASLEYAKVLREHEHIGSLVAAGKSVEAYGDEAITYEDAQALHLQRNERRSIGTPDYQKLYEQAGETPREVSVQPLNGHPVEMGDGGDGNLAEEKSDVH